MVGNETFVLVLKFRELTADIVKVGRRLFESLFHLLVGNAVLNRLFVRVALLCQGRNTLVEAVHAVSLCSEFGCGTLEVEICFLVPVTCDARSLGNRRVHLIIDLAESAGKSRLFIVLRQRNDCIFLFVGQAVQLTIILQ